MLKKSHQTQSRTRQAGHAKAVKSDFGKGGHPLYSAASGWESQGWSRPLDPGSQDRFWNGLLEGVGGGEPPAAPFILFVFQLQK